MVCPFIPLMSYLFDLLIRRDTGVFLYLIHVACTQIDRFLSFPRSFLRIVDSTELYTIEILYRELKKLSCRIQCPIIFQRLASIVFTSVLRSSTMLISTLRFLSIQPIENKMNKTYAYHSFLVPHFQRYSSFPILCQCVGAYSYCVVIIVLWIY